MALHDAVYMFISSFVALFPVLNPIGNGFIVNGFLEGLDDAQRRVVIKQITRNCLLIGLCSLAVGKLILLIFNLAVPVIQLGGGILICKMGFDWLYGPVSAVPSEGQRAIDEIELEEIEKKAFYPIAFPVCFGPGSISVIFTLMAGASVQGNFLATGLNYLIIAAVIVIQCVILYLLFAQGARIITRVGPSGSLIINKLVAFFTFCIGIQIIVTGLSAIFHLNISVGQG